MENQVVVKKEKIGIGERLAYLFGGWNASMLSFVAATYLSFFYTDIFGLSTEIVSILLLAGRIWDGVNDVLIGIFADNTTTKWGKVRPFFLWFAIPAGITFILMYQVPDLSLTWKVIYAFVTYLLFDTMYSFIYVPNTAILVSATLP